MASFLSKALRGATQAGGALYADIAREQFRAGIVTERDAVLNGNRQAMEKSRQEASTLQHKERLAQQESQFTRGLDSPRAQTDKLNLASAKRLEALKVAHHAATTDEERKSIARQMAAEQADPLEGKPGSVIKPTAGIQEARILAKLEDFKNEADPVAAALKFIKSKEGGMVKSLYTQLLKAQEEAMVLPGDPGYLTVEDAYLKGKEIARSKKPVTGGDDGKIEHFNTSKNPSVKTQADYDKIKSGEEYFDIFAGKSYRKK